MNYCMICFDLTKRFNRAIVGICRELHMPVCREHADGCDMDGHGIDPLPEDSRSTVKPA